MTEEGMLEIRILAKTLETLHEVWESMHQEHALIGATEIIECMSAVARRLRDVLEGEG